MGAPGHPPCTQGTGHSGHLPPSLKATAAALWAPRSPPQRQAHYQTSYAAGSNIVCSATGFCLSQWFSQAAAAQPGGLHRGSAGRGRPGPPGVNAVQFVVLPFHSSGSSGRPPSASALGTPIQGGLPWGLSVPLCSALYSPCILCICQKNCKSSRESQFVRNGKIG